MPFKKVDPIAEAQAAVDRLEAQRAKLAGRAAELSGRLDEARAARRAALISGELDDAAQAAVDKAFADAAEAHGFVEEEIRAVSGQIDEAAARRDGLRDAAARAEVAADCERRAAALDAAAEALATAAEVFGEARAAMAAAIGEHGARVDNPLSTDGSTSAAMLGRPVVLAAVRLAAPGVLPAADGLGEAHSDDPLLAMRRAQSGKIRDHADDVRDGRLPPVEMPRPGSAAPSLPPRGALGSAPSAPDGLTLVETMARTVFAVPVAFYGAGGIAMVQADPGDTEAPLRVVRKAEEQELSFPPDSPEGRAIVARLKASGGQFRARPPVFIDTEADTDPAPARPGRAVTTTWPDGRRA